MKKQFLLTNFFILLGRTLCWNLDGHRVILELAGRDLPEDLKAKLLEMQNKNFPEIKYCTHFYDFAAMADIIKQTYGFHWLQEFHYNEEGRKSIENYRQSGITNSIHYLINYLLKGKHNDCLETLALMFLTHLVGDMHQPFHIIEWKSGGLKEKMNKKYSIHRYWDEFCRHRNEMHKITDFTDRLIRIFENDETTNINGEEVKLSVGDFVKQPNLATWFDEIHQDNDFFYWSEYWSKEEKLKYSSFCQKLELKQLYKAGIRLRYILKGYAKRDIPENEKENMISNDLIKNFEFSEANDFLYHPELFQKRR